MALTTLYAYCRRTDDIVDSQPEPEKREAVRQKLNHWKEETIQACRWESMDPQLQELSRVVSQYHIPQSYFLELIEGVEMDLDHLSYATLEDLYPYCYKVASVVGLICLEIFGCSSPKSKEYAVELGLAFQWTNILRDIKTDALRGRIYIPVNELKKYDFSPEGFRDLVLNPHSLSKKESENFQRLILSEVDRTKKHYDRSQSAVSPEERPNLIAAEVMRSVYFKLLRKIEKNPLKVLKEKIRLSKLELFTALLKGWLFS